MWLIGLRWWLVAVMGEGLNLTLTTNSLCCQGWS